MVLILAVFFDSATLKSGIIFGGFFFNISTSTRCINFFGVFLTVGTYNVVIIMEGTQTRG